ncbi:hypothetical protein ANN_06002 [Periplaneta americana]|uniref:Uncharacterized protein n=1 Tax=Periplaneta americana TaxID=6978 RepID=A0ABQ8TE17_PERAM|nr:hypothetical protein ANN_06002 [Periplaneta americana]
MAGLCEDGNEPTGFSKSHNSLVLRAVTLSYAEFTPQHRIELFCFDVSLLAVDIGYTSTYTYMPNLESGHKVSW